LAFDGPRAFPFSEILGLKGAKDLVDGALFYLPSRGGAPHGDDVSKTWRNIVMNTGSSVTRWILGLKQGDQSAAKGLWEAYFRRLVGLAQARLRDAPRRIADEEDVALSAFDSFCRGARAGRFPRLDDRHDLWQILVMITVRKAIDLRNYEGRQSRGMGRVQSLTELTPEGLETIGGDEPTAELAAQLAEEYQRLMGQLGDPTLQSVAIWKLEGYTNDEIAARLGCVTKTVERKLALIRSKWAREIKS
jgi:DNA-directed RNA polymerase specialized sigma24 family protein